MTNEGKRRVARVLWICALVVPLLMIFTPYYHSAYGVPMIIAGAAFIMEINSSEGSK